MKAILGVLILLFVNTNVHSSEKTVNLEQIKNESKDLINTLNKYSYEQRDQAIKKMNSAIISLDRNIEIIENRIGKNWSDMNQDAKIRAKEALNKMRDQRNKLSKWFERTKNSTRSAWSHLEDGFSKAFSELANSLEKSAKEF